MNKYLVIFEWTGIIEAENKTAALLKALHTKVLDEGVMLVEEQ